MTLSKWVTWVLIVLAVLTINAAVVASIAGITFALGRTAYQPTVSAVPPCIPSVDHC
jgi:Mn2+/Fe2+ NRAMP family transporter